MENEPEELPGLIDRLNAGERAAHDELFTRIYPRLVELAGLMLGTFSDIRRQHDAESVVHCAWIDLETSLQSVKPDSPAGYLRLATMKGRLALLDIAKKERRRLDTVPLRPGTASPDDSAPTFDPSAGSSCDPGRLEIWARFHEEVSDLPDEQREVFEPYFYTDEKVSQTEIAELLGLPPRQVSRLIAKAKDRLVERVQGLHDLLS